MSLYQPWLFIVLLGMVCIVISFLAPRSTTTGTANMVKEIEDTMEHFVSEIEDENQQLLQSVAQIKNDHELQMNRLISKVDQLERQNYILSQDIKNIALAKLQQLPADMGMQENAKAAVEAVNPPQMQMKMRYSELFQYHEHGKSIEYIAKKLNLNKGEVQLIIQLAKQEELNRV